MRNVEYYIELREEARELKGKLVKDFKELLDENKGKTLEFTSDEERKEYYAERNKKLSGLRTQSDILSGQITVFNHILNYDTPIVLGKNVEYRL